MNQYILINRITVQNANAIAGFTWGFPAITHFLGFSHNLSRKLAVHENLKDICLTGCAVIAHDYYVHKYRSSDYFEFVQSRNPPYLHGIDRAKKATPPPIIEEGKMNMTVSLLIGCKGNIGNRTDNFCEWLRKTSLLQRLAGGTILDIDIDSIKIYSADNESEVRLIKRKLLPGFVLRDRSNYLEQHYQKLQKEEPDTELLDAWLDFASFKQKARPKSDLVSKHLSDRENRPDDPDLMEIWDKHLQVPYQKDAVPDELKTYFNKLASNQANQKVSQQWQSYCNPTEETDADWEYIPKPNTGYLVPIMTGYKAISDVHKNEEVENTRDSETDICFVEAVHSVGEWLSIHRLKTVEDLNNCMWRYHYEQNWYLCKQGSEHLADNGDTQDITNEDSDSDF